MFKVLVQSSNNPEWALVYNAFTYKEKFKEFEGLVDGMGVFQTEDLGTAIKFAGLMATDFPESTYQVVEPTELFKEVLTIKGKSE